MADDVGALAPGALERGVALVVQDAAVEAVDQHEAARPGGELRGGLVERTRAPEDAELGEHGHRHGRADAVDDVRGEEGVLVDHLRLCGEGVGHGQVHLDGVGTALRRPRRAARVVGDEGVGIAPGLRGAHDAHDQDLAPADALLRAPDVLAPHVRLHRGLAEGHGERRHPCGRRAAGDGGGQLLVLDVADVGQTPRGTEGRPHGGVGQDVVAEPRVGLHPPGVEERARRDAEVAVQAVVEERAARSLRDAPSARQGGRVPVVPLVGPIEPPSALPNVRSLQSIQQSIEELPVSP